MKLTIQHIAFIAVGALVLSACHADRHLRGSVTTVPGDEQGTQGQVYGAGQPLADAEIEYICPDESESAPMPKVTSGDDGRFYFTSYWTWSPNCQFLVSHDGYYPQEFLVEDLCHEYYQGGCRYLVIQAELLPLQQE